MTNPEPIPQLGRLELAAIHTLAVAGLLELRFVKAVENETAFFEPVPIRAVNVALITETPGTFRSTTLADVAPLVAALADDPDVIALLLRDDIASRHALMVKIGFKPWPNVLGERQDWYARVAAVRPWEPRRFVVKARELIDIAGSLGSTGRHVREACVHAAERALPWRIDDADEAWRAAEKRRLIDGVE